MTERSGRERKLPDFMQHGEKDMDSFKWENVVIRDDGTRILDCEIHGKRIR